MAAFLRAGGPWSQLVRLGEIALREVPPGGRIDLGEGVAAELLAVPHRDEYSDTVAVMLRGPRATLLYVPDTEPWRTWPRPLPEVLADHGVDVALLDGTFYSPDELPGRPVASIGHPLMTDTMDLLAPTVAAGRTRVVFTHLNHSNPALDPASDAARAIVARGFAVAAEGEEIAL
jgi:pyrroloquinoline quinone biosynthesis protein B